MKMQYIELSGNQTNNTGLFWLILGYSGNYTITRNGGQIGSLNPVVPAGIVPPGATITGGTAFYGLQGTLKDIEGKI